MRVTVDLGDWRPSEGQLRYLAVIRERNGAITAQEWRAVSGLFVWNSQLTPLGEAVLRAVREEAK